MYVCIHIYIYIVLCTHCSMLYHIVSLRPRLARFVWLGALMGVAADAVVLATRTLSHDIRSDSIIIYYILFYYIIL